MVSQTKVDTYTTLNRQSVALITVDVQNDFVLPDAPAEIPGTNQLVPKMVTLIHAFRRSQQPIIHMVRLYLPDGSNVDCCRRGAIRAGQQIVQPGTAGAELVEALKPTQSSQLDTAQLLQGTVQQIGYEEYVIYKPRWGAFYRTPLERFLRKRRIDSLVFCGCNYPNCPRTSIYEASERDFRIAIAADAVSGFRAEGVRELEGIGVVVQETEHILSWVHTPVVAPGLVRKPQPQGGRRPL